MSVGNERGIVGEIQIDLKRLHETWMEIVYPRQRAAAETVLGKWRPDTTLGMVLYRAWSAVGVPVVGAVYPLVLLGTIVRFQSRRIDDTAARLGIAGVVLVSLVVWGTLTAVARFQLDLLAGGLTALIAASGVATVAAGLAVLARQVDGRPVTVLFAYPLGMTAIFLPPVVAALFSETVAAVVLPGSRDLANFLLDTAARPLGLYDFFTENFDLQGVAYALLWLGISVPLGWLFGVLVTLADFVRPKE